MGGGRRSASVYETLSSLCCCHQALKQKEKSLFTERQHSKEEPHGSPWVQRQSANSASSRLGTESGDVPRLPPSDHPHQDRGQQRSSRGGHGAVPPRESRPCATALHCYRHPVSNGRTDVPRAATMARPQQDGRGSSIPSPSLLLRHPLNTRHISTFTHPTIKRPTLCQGPHCVSESSHKDIRFLPSFTDKYCLDAVCRAYTHSVQTETLK